MLFVILSSTSVIICKRVISLTKVITAKNKKTTNEKNNKQTKQKLRNLSKFFCTLHPSLNKHKQTLTDIKVLINLT